VTVAQFVNFEDPFENAAAAVIKQAAAQTNSMAGDGTTTATVLAREVLTEKLNAILPLGHLRLNLSAAWIRCRGYCCHP
jgi:chaperonin GroEL (HSP60 family)